MNPNTSTVLHALIKKGWIDRREDAVLWNLYENMEIQEELECFKSGFSFDLYPTNGRIYLIPTLENDLFLKNNVDYRKDIKAGNEVRTKDLYLFNYMSIYLIYLFFNGDGINPLCRDFITKEDFVDKFTEHCRIVENIDLDMSSIENDYSENFIRLAQMWLSKVDGENNSLKFDHKYGFLNRILLKFKTDEIFYETEDKKIKPTRKMIDIMPYFLRKDRVGEIQKWIKEKEYYASNQ